LHVRLPATLSGDYLTIYLNDHLAGSTFGMELARRTASENEDTEFGAPLKELAGAIEEDRRELEGMMERLGVPRDPIKPALGWTLEKVGRLKLNGRLVGYSPLSRLVELEAVGSGVQGKLSMWRVLRTIAPREPRLEIAALDRLIRRAESQLDTLAALQSRAGEIALPRA
jgi:hypothetical protein